MKKFIFVGTLLLSALAFATLKTWSNGETIKASDLNSNFSQTIRAPIVNADISGAAAIAHSKMATPALLPKAWVLTSGACAGGGAAGTTCTLAESAGGTWTVKANGTTGQYRVHLPFSPTNANYAVLITPYTANAFCTVGSVLGGTGDGNLTHFIVTCLKTSDLSTLDAVLSIMVMDT